MEIVDSDEEAEDLAEEAMEHYIEQAWSHFDTNNEGYLDKESSQNFVISILEHFKRTDQFSVEGYSEVYAHFEKDTAGKVSKYDLILFLDEFL